MAPGPHCHAASGLSGCSFHFCPPLGLGRRGSRGTGTPARPLARVAAVVGRVAMVSRPLLRGLSLSVGLARVLRRKAFVNLPALTRAGVAFHKAKQSTCAPPGPRARGRAANRRGTASRMGHTPLNQRAAGSSPAAPTKQKQRPTGRNGRLHEAQ